MSTVEELNERVSKLSTEHRAMLADAFDVLSQCFGDEKGSAMLVFVPPEENIAQIFLMNCSEADAYSIADFAKTHVEAMVTRGMPDKEHLN